MYKWLNSEDELIKKTKELKNLKLKDLILNYERNPKNKGDIGQIVEREFYKIPNNSDKSPDFKNLGIELKVTPLKIIKDKKDKNKTIYAPKERVKITQLILNRKDFYFYDNFYESGLYYKINKILFIFYLPNKEFSETKFIDFLFYKFNDNLNFKSQILKDYEKIINKIKLGKAHQLSESDTYYLGVARSGSGGIKERKISQPYNLEIPVYQRAFVFKMPLMRNIINANLNKFDFAFKIKEDKELIDIILNKLNKYKNLTLIDICEKIFDIEELNKYKINPPKNISNLVFKKILMNEKLFDEYKNRFLNNNDSSDIEIKTVRISKNNNSLKEDWKIKYNLFNEFKNYSNWFETSYYKKILNIQYYIVFITKELNNNYLDSVFLGLKKIYFIDEEIMKIEKLFNESKTGYLKTGFINSESKKGNKWSSRKINGIVHIRPGAKDSKQTILIPCGEKVVNHYIWFNKEFIFNKLEKEDYLI